MTDLAQSRPAGVSEALPVRTCVGCRARVQASILIRVVASIDHDSQLAAASLIVDQRRRLPGRGAWLHPDEKCVDLAEKRRAFARALRVPVAGSLDAVRTFVRLAEPEVGNADPGENQVLSRK